MKSAQATVALLLLLRGGLAAASGESGGRLEEATVATAASISQPDVHAALREMSALVAEQKVELSFAKTQIQALETRLRASENLVDQMKKENQEQKAQLLELSSSNTEMSSSLLELKRLSEEGRVVFSLAFATTTSGWTGPFNTGTTLVYKQIFSNVGNGYNSNTGFFTAPVRGVYDFSFSLHSSGGSVTMLAYLRKNKEVVVSVYATQSSHHNNASNGASLLLEVGDVVDVYLPENNRVFDNQYHYSTFRGHLFFPVEAPPTKCSQ